MGIPTALAILFLVLGAVPPLTDADPARLAGAPDGGDPRDDAFAAMVGHVGRWSPGLGATIRAEAEPPLCAAGDVGRRVCALAQAAPPLMTGLPVRKDPG